MTLKNERAMMKELAKMCLASLAKYSTTQKQDEEQLMADGGKGTPLEWNERNALHLMVNEKQIFNSWLEVSQLALPLLKEGADFSLVQELALSIKNPILQAYWNNELKPLYQQLEKA